jgi:hypothetical protein
VVAAARTSALDWNISSATPCRSALALGLAVAPHADDVINLTDLPNLDALPTCQMEDGSDAASLPCVWTNDGTAWLTYDDHSVLIVDDTVRSHAYAATDDDG